MNMILAGHISESYNPFYVAESHDPHSLASKKRMNDIIAADVDKVQDLITHDLTQNNMFMEDHDLDFNLNPNQNDLFEYMDSIDEPVAIQMVYKNSHRGLSSRRQDQSFRDFQQVVSSEPDMNPFNKSQQSSFQNMLNYTQVDETADNDDLLEQPSQEEFKYQMEKNIYDVRNYKDEKALQISIFSLRQDFFLDTEDNQLLIKNVEMLNQNNHLEDFYSYIKQMKLHIKNQLQQQHMMNVFLKKLTLTLEKFQEVCELFIQMFEFQSNFVVLVPTMTITNEVQGFQYQYERFVSQANFIFESSIFKTLSKDDKDKILFFDENSQNKTNFKAFDFYRVQNTKDKVQPEFDKQLVECPLIGVIYFKALTLVQSYDHFLHLRSQTNRFNRMKQLVEKLHSRLRLRRLLPPTTEVKSKKKVLRSQFSLLNDHNVMANNNLNMQKIFTLQKEDILTNFTKDFQCHEFVPPAKYRLQTIKSKNICNEYLMCKNTRMMK